VQLSPGNHRVTFSYRPPHIALAYVAFVLSLLWLIGWPRLGSVGARLIGPVRASVSDRYRASAR
jgi:hypothetical protein